MKLNKYSLLVTSIIILSGCIEVKSELQERIDANTFAPVLSERGFSSEELVSKALARIDNIDKRGPNLQSVLSVNPKALEIAQKLDAKMEENKEYGPLYGKPILIKDNVETKDDLPTTGGSWALKNNKNNRDSPVVKKLRDSGAVILGKTNLSQWANFRSESSTSGWSSVRGQVKNPHVLNRSPCGSSSGSGAAVASGIVAAAIGTETNGSIICPSTMNGIVGFKPTVGLLSQKHIIPISSTQDTAGPMTLTVEGAAIMMDAMTDNDGSYVSGLDKIVPQNTTIGILNFAKGNNFGVNNNFDKAIEELKAKGFDFVEIESWEPGEGFFEAAYKVLKYEFKSTLNNYLSTTNPDVEVRSLKDLIEFNKKDLRELEIFDQSIFLASEKLEDLNSEDYKNSLELILNATRKNGIDKLMKQYNVDFLTTPSAAPTFLIDHMYGDTYPGGTGAGWIPAIAGYPHITVPMGTYKNLPTGLSFISGAGKDKEVISMGYAYEQVSGGMRERPKYLQSIETNSSGTTLKE